MKNELILTLIDHTGQTRTNEFINIGIPLPRGHFFSSLEIELSAGHNKLVPSEKSATAYWPDKSIKWCLLRFLVSPGAHENLDIFLSKVNPLPLSSKKKQLIFEDSTTFNIKTKNCSFNLNKRKFNLFDQVKINKKPVLTNGFCKLINTDNKNFDADINNVSHKSAYTENSPLYSELFIEGQFRHQSVPYLNYEARLIFQYQTDTVHCAFTLHNPKRAIHPSGIWDLGDINSQYINNLSIGFELLDKTDIHWKTEPDKKWSTLSGSKLNIYQESSGGENWNSPNHKNKDNIIPLNQKGYICQFDQTTETGERASPKLGLGTNVGIINISIDKFWQNFPKSLSVNENRVEIGLFPEQFPDNFEIQPGEKKTHNFQLNFTTNADLTDNATHPLSIHINQNWVNQCKIFPYTFKSSKEDPIEKIIREGLTGKNNFFIKRELIDEYGWRNFGDLYADHEADLYEGEEIFISHYNNQYDPLYGFLHQYLLSGDNQWMELADDLAKHITDIDIYHTSHDIYEYNGGAFWHTDHYLEAKTSSHRSYSKYHQYIYEGHAGGGGPGGQHCYTTGLLFHYLLTGSESSKQAVLQLCDWVANIYDGSSTLLGLLMALKYTRRVDLKNILTGKYPLDRGTGYYVNALLDKFYLTQEQSVLQQAGHVIRNTVHPRDDINARNLEDVEKKWFYTIFLQYLCRYLQTKEEISQLDEEFYYARDSLLHYADWMIVNEYPYLEKPEILEFPNHTWTAQDIRKVNILFFAAHYSENKENQYLQKAAQIQKYINENLSTEPTRSYTRILSILMQNHIPQDAIKNYIKKKNYKQIKNYEPLDQPSSFLYARNLFFEFIRIVRQFSIRNEIKWLNKRIQLLSKFSGNT